jgi:hypothetical protein
VANVIGFTQERATQELEDAGLQVDPRFKVIDSVKPGRVIDQDPVPGTIVDPESTVIITIAKAPPPVVVPTFTGLTLGDAQTLATENHLVLVPTEGQSDTVPVGSVISQDPPPGGEVPQGTEIQIVVSAPPATVAVTDVTCLSFGSAKSALQAQGLVAVLGGTMPVLPQCPNPNRVAVQDPAAGTTDPAGVPLMDLSSLDVAATMDVGGVEGLRLDKVSILGRQLFVPFGKNEQIRVASFSFDGGKFNRAENLLEVADVILKNGDLRFSRNPKGALLPLDLLYRGGKGTAQGKDTENPLLHYRIGRISGTDMTAVFTDNVRKQRPSFAFNRINFTLEKLSGPPFAPIPFSLAGTYGEQGSLRASGTVRPARDASWRTASGKVTLSYSSTNLITSPPRPQP